MTVTILSVATFCWLAWWSARAFSRIAAGARDAVLFVTIAHGAFAALPLLLDVLVGYPDYLNQPGFYAAAADPGTCIIYCLYVSACPVLWWWAGRTRKKHGRSKSEPTPRRDQFQFLQRHRPLLYLLLIGPCLVLLRAPDPAAYLSYGSVALGITGPEMADYHQYMVLATTLATLAGPALFVSQRRIRTSTWLTVLPWLLLAFWLNGKRSIVFTTAALLGIILWRGGHLRRVRLSIAAPLLVCTLVLFSIGYQAVLRHQRLSEVDLWQLYENARIDFGRDNAIKMPIFAELNPDRMQILDYRGQSLVFYATMLVPRELWPEKPLPFAQYFTSAMLQSVPKMWGWGMTTSWLGEAIANCGWWGLLLGPLALALICRWGDGSDDATAGALTALVGILFLSVQLVAFAPLFVLWIVMTLGARMPKRTRWIRRSPGRTPVRPRMAALPDTTPAFASGRMTP